jgi:hypothetical protein
MERWGFSRQPLSMGLAELKIAPKISDQFTDDRYFSCDGQNSAKDND